MNTKVKRILIANAFCFNPELAKKRIAELIPDDLIEDFIIEGIAKTLTDEQIESLFPSDEILKHDAKEDGKTLQDPIDKLGGTLNVEDPSGSKLEDEDVERVVVNPKNPFGITAIYNVKKPKKRTIIKYDIIVPGLYIEDMREEDLIKLCDFIRELKQISNMWQAINYILSHNFRFCLAENVDLKEAKRIQAVLADLKINSRREATTDSDSNKD